MAYSILVQGFCPLKLKLLNFLVYFDLKPFAFSRLQKQGFVENDEVLRAKRLKLKVCCQWHMIIII